MSQPPPGSAGLSPVFRDDPLLEPLIGPGAPFEVEEVVVDGVPLRDFVRGPRTILDAFRMGSNHADLVNLVFESERLTFAEVQQLARRLGREMRDTFGVEQGDRVAIGMRNLPEFVISFWGAALLGAVVVPLNSWWTGEELDYAIDNAGATVAVLDDERLERLRSVGGQPSGLHLIGARSVEANVSFDDLVTGSPLEDDEYAPMERDDPVTILYTSGTTGRPKGALGTSRGHLANLWNMAFGSAREAAISGRAPAAPGQAGTLAAAPLFHIGGIAAILGGPIGGTKMVLMRKWDVEEAVRLALEENVTNLGGVPAMAQNLLEHPDIGSLGLDVRSFPLGGAPVPPDLPLRAVEIFGEGIQLLNGYGLTETTSAVVTNVGVEFATRPDSVGRPNLTADIKVVDPDGRVVGTGEVGELCFRSPQVVRGYWNDDEATAASFVDGWFHSGDVGYINAEGFVHVVDRIKDVVIRGGENVYCAEVEAVLHQHPKVSQVTIIGLPERAMGERVCAVVVARQGATPSLGELREFASSSIAAFKQPEALWLADELPQTATGKIAKNVLRQQVADAPSEVLERLW